MLRTALLCGVFALTLGVGRGALADTVLYCVPDEPRVTARDRLVSVEVKILPNGNFASVVYRAANGATYDRGAQYDASNSQYQGEHVWIGALRVNRSVGMVGTLHRYNGQLFYVETVHDKLQGGKVVSQVTSLCNEPAPNYATAPLPPPTPQQPAPTPNLPDPEIKKFVDCVDAAAVALAGISNEPAQTVVDAATGECPKEQVALENALERQGIAKSLDFVAGLTKEMRPNLLAMVLNARASAAKPPGEPAKTEPTKGQPL